MSVVGNLPSDKHPVEFLLVNLLQDDIRGGSQLCCIPAFAPAPRVMQGSIMNGGKAVSSAAIDSCTAPGMTLEGWQGSVLNQPLRQTLHVQGTLCTNQ